MPGEIESRRRVKRRERVPVPHATWQQTLKLASKLAVSLDDVMSWTDTVADDRKTESSVDPLKASDSMIRDSVSVVSSVASI